MRNNLALSALTGILVALSLPPFRMGFLAYVALIPFFLLIENKSLKESCVWSYVTGLCINVTSLFWIGWVTIPGLVGALLILPLFTSLYGILHAFLFRRFHQVAYLISPFLWTAFEYIQSFGETAFPWVTLGYSQTYYTKIIQFAEFTSVYGVSFLVVTLNVLLLFLWKKSTTRRQKSIIVVAVIALIFFPYLYGQKVMVSLPIKEKLCKIALLQGNVDPFEKWQKYTDEDNVRIYETLIREAAANRPDLIIMPETAMPFFLRYEPQYLRRLRHIADSLDVAIFTGGLDYEYNRGGRNHHYNATFLIEPHSLGIQSYRKMQLVPFSEKVPYRNYFPFNVLKNLLFDMELGIGDYSSGEDYTVFYLPMKDEEENADSSSVNITRFSSAICYESVFPDINRRFVKENIDFLTVVTNDAWFGKTSAPYQHAQIAVFRAIENRISIARCANTGISCFIDPFGRIRNESKLFVKTIVVDDISPRLATTFYTTHGNVFAKIVSLVSIVVFIVGIFKKAFHRD
ncbi:apolipoprotein N-acyltransferase [candidate division KSB1 bacterium RBG_16_48_16]|nr:MAG: apolipoprotein N-acyltransferase [candidate division KSB1 bacterium RBG_16_48_16]